MGRFRYYYERTVAWMLNNKIIVLLSLLSFSLFVSTLAIAGQRNRLSEQLDELRKSLTTTTELTTLTTGNDKATEVTEPVTEVPSTESPTTELVTELSTVQAGTESSTTETETESTTDVTTSEVSSSEAGGVGEIGNTNDNGRSNNFEDNDDNRNEPTVTPVSPSDKDLYSFDSKMMKVLGF